MKSMIVQRVGLLNVRSEVLLEVDCYKSGRSRIDTAGDKARRKD